MYWVHPTPGPGCSQRRERRGERQVEPASVRAGDHVPVDGRNGVPRQRWREPVPTVQQPVGDHGREAGLRPAHLAAGMRGGPRRRRRRWWRQSSRGQRAAAPARSCWRHPSRWVHGLATAASRGNASCLVATEAGNRLRLGLDIPRSPPPLFIAARSSQHRQSVGAAWMILITPPRRETAVCAFTNSPMVALSK